MSHIKSYGIPFVILLLIILLSGCRGFTRRLNPPPSKIIKPTAEIISTAVESTPASSTTPALDVLPTPVVIQVAWLDRTPFEDGLISGSRSVLSQRYDRSIYHLQVKVADDYQTVTLKEEILYTNHEDITLDKVILRMYPAIFGARVKYSGFLINGINTQPVIRSNDSVIEFPLKDGLKVGESIVLSIDLDMQMPADPSGNYQVFGFVDNLLTLAHFYPIVAVYDSSGWHEELPPAYGDVVYSDTSYYLVEVTLPGDAVLVSSGISRESRMENNHQIVMLAGGPMRDFYLAAGPGLEKISNQVGETTVNSYANPEIQDGNERALDTAAEALRIFTQDIGPYPYSEFDVLATSTTALGVEYPGVTVINRTIYQRGNNSNSVPNSVYLESTIAHEVGHQWFYNVLGDDQVNQPWLDESLAQYITGLYFTERYGDQAAEGFKNSWYSRWDQVDRQEIPIGMPVKNYDPKTYGAIIYGRGPIFLTALHDEMGAEVFTRFLKDYYSQNMWENVTSEILMKTAEATCSCDLDGIFNKWVVSK